MRAALIVGALIALVATIAGVGCYGPLVYECRLDDECVRAGRTGRCVSSPRGARACAFSDATCASGLRFDATAGSDATQCVDPNGVGDLGPILTDDGGGATDDMGPPPATLRWTAQTSTATYDLWSVGGYDAQHVWVGGQYELFFTANGGTTWTAKTGMDLDHVTGIFARQNDAYLVGWYQIIHYIGDGASYTTSAPPAELYAIWGLDASKLFAVGAQETVMTGSSGNWSAFVGATCSGCGYLNAVWGAGAATVYAGGGDGKIIRTTNGGTSWDPDGAPVPKTIHGMWGTGADDVYAVGVEQFILRRDPSGWSVVKTPNGDPLTALNAVWGSGPRDVYAVGTGGTILRSTDRGMTWVPQQSGTTQSLTAIWGSDASNVFVVGTGGTIRHGAP